MINDKAKLQQFDEFKEYEDYTNADYSKRKTIAELFFYTIATNYSIQSFIAQDYSDEDIYTSNATNPGIWLNNLFHKNDGYMTPIVLNPYRDDGWINMNTESHLTKARLAALFIEEAPDKSILDEEYSFSELYLTLDRHRLKDKFTDGKGNRRFPNAGEVQGEKNNVQNNKDHEFHDENEYLTEFCKIASNSDSYANVILSKLGFQVTPGMDNLQIQIRMYLVYKIFSIAAKYPNYNTFRSYFGNINYTFDIMPLESRSHTIKKLHNLIEKVKSDTSHIGLKFRQAMKFIEKGKNLVEKDVHKRLSYTDYAKLLGIYSHGMSVKERTEWLPPGIFNYEIILKKKSTGALVPLNHLSSGERQFLYLTSTLVYHAMNLNSVPENTERIRYKRINYILDEVEICFHPEYQRQFINRLIRLFERTRLNEAFDINILITTHSPFILSDIPSDNILYLQDGNIENEDKEFVNPFGANVNDVLQQSFFMSNGFTGAFAQKKIRSLINYLKNESKADSNWDETGAKEVIEYIGEPFVKGALEELYEQKFNKRTLQDDNDIDRLKMQIEELEQRIKELLNEKKER